jgi:hypothetical protein
MATGVVELALTEPPDDWELADYDKHINRLIDMYRNVYLFMNIGDSKAQFNMAEKIHESIWIFRDARHAKFPDERDKWMLVEDF